MTISSFKWGSDRENRACRIDFRCQLQPVPGRGVFDRSRSHFNHCSSDLTRMMMSRSKSDLTETIGPAGSTTGVDCSLCQAGTYSSGSGLVSFCGTGYSLSNKSSPKRRSDKDHRAAGATTSFSCSLCQAGTFWTGSGLALLWQWLPAKQAVSLES